jgi:Arc/MetJ-type ribon-helix-helix transcriptional regulator
VSFKLGKYDRRRPLILDSVLAYSTYLGGSAFDEGHGIAVDSAGNAYVTVFTFSTNFPTVNPIQPANCRRGNPPPTAANGAQDPSTRKRGHVSLYPSRQAPWREPIPEPNTMKTLEIEIPDQLGRQIEELVRRGWFTDENDLARQALGDFLRHHRLELQEQQQLDDIEWARRLKEQAR